MAFGFERSDFEPLLYYYLNNLPRRVEESSLGPADESSKRSSSSAIGCPNDSHITKIVVYSRLFVANQKRFKTEKIYYCKKLLILNTFGIQTKRKTETTPVEQIINCQLVRLGTARGCEYKVFLSRTR